MESAPDRVNVDISLAKAEFGLKDFVSLKERLKKTIEWNQEFIVKHKIKS